MAASAGRAGLRVLAGVVIIAALATASRAQAGLIGTGPASYCDPNVSKPFSPWGDSSYYSLLQNGSFENGTTGWSLSKGAKVVGENEPFFLRAATDRHSLLLTDKSSAESGTVCFALGDWHLRFVAKNVGSKNGSLHVSLIVPSLLGGLATILDGGTVTGNASWAPTPRLELLLSNVTSLVGTRAVAFRFTTEGKGASFQIDDVYLDPWKCM
jgi:hypothetical protein